MIESPGQIDLFNKPKYVKTDVDQSHTTDRLDTIKKFFNEFGSEYKFKVKVQRNHDYTTFDEDRLIEHVLWWFLVKVHNKPQSEVKRLWETDQRSMFVHQLKNHPIVKRYIKILFY